MPQACSSSTPPPIRLIVDCLKEREKKKVKKLKYQVRNPEPICGGNKDNVQLYWEGDG